MQKLSLIRPDDWHLHVRDGAGLTDVLTHSARQFARAVIMPNLKPPVTTVEMALAYRQRILNALAPDTSFVPLMTLYLTESTPISEVPGVAEHPEMLGFKLYPAGATTHSEAGVTNLDRIYPILDAMQALDVPLLVHGEITDPDCDIFDREKAFIDIYLTKIGRQFPNLRTVFEHVTTKDAVEFVVESPPNIAATITPQHLLYNRNMLLAGDIRPHFYCLPVLKRETHRRALIEAATSGNSKFFLGTDSAPHPKSEKESASGCAGCFSAPAALELYAHAFESANSLDKLEQFASFNGADFYRLPRNKTQILLEKSAWTVPESYPFAGERVVPLRAGENMHWKTATRP